jgi:WD40 repeat protein
VAVIFGRLRGHRVAGSLRLACLEAVKVLDAVTLERLHTFTAPRDMGTRWLSFSPDSRSLTLFLGGDYGIITWDLQTGGRIGAILSAANAPPAEYFSSAYSVDGKVVAVAYRENHTVTVISTYNLVSGTHIYSHRVLEGRIVASIWTHGEYLRFATVKPGSITIWEVGFTSIHTLAEVESLPAPDDIGSEECLFLPTRSRLAFILNWIGSSGMGCPGFQASPEFCEQRAARVTFLLLRWSLLRL